MIDRTVGYEVRGCEAWFGRVESWPLLLQGDIDRAKWFTVDRVEGDGTRQPLADFYTVDKARAFAQWLENKPRFVSDAGICIDPTFGDAVAARCAR